MWMVNYTYRSLYTPPPPPGTFEKEAGRAPKAGLDAAAKRRISDPVGIRSTVVQPFSQVYLAH
jgi:hypothetical protein